MRSKVIVNIKKLISVLICTMLISSTLPPNLLNYVVFAANQSVSNFDELKNAVNNANNGDIITLTSNITIPNSATATEANYHCVLNCSKNITIKSVSGQKYTIYHRSPDGILAMINGCTVNFENITIDFGRTSDSSNFDVDNTLIRLYDGSTLNMKSGTTLQNAYVKDGSAIYCTGSNINIDQTSSIKNLNTPFDGALYIDNGSTLTLNGSLLGCRAANGGAIYANHNSTLTLNGNISSCLANYSGGAMFINDSTLTLNGNISNCTANTNGGAISAIESSTLNITSTISDCIARRCGGAIFLDDSKLTLNGNISNCTTDNNGNGGGGGAIYNSYDSELRMGSGSISGCATDYSAQGNAIYNGLGSKIYLPSPSTNLVSIDLSYMAAGEDNAKDKYGYDGIYDDNYDTPATMLYRVQFELNGGVDNNGHTSIDPAYVVSGETLGDMLPTNLTKTVSGVALNLYRWVDSNKNTVTSSTIINSDITLHARYGAPQISIPTITKEQSGSTYNAGDWSNENITLSYSISSPDISINPERYKISLNGTDFNDASIYSSSDTLRIDSSDASTLRFTILKGGEYEIRIQAFDSEGLSTTSDPISVKIDTVKPDPVTIDSSEYSNVDTVELYGTGEPGCIVTATDENNNVIGTAIVDENGEWAITTSPMSDGQHTISVVQTDSAGNTSDPITQDIVVDTIPPTANISIGSNNFSQFLNTITFGLLFKETTNVTISASDDSPPSGIKAIEYLKTDQVYSTVTDIPTNADWQTDTMSNNSISFDIALPLEELNDKFFIYARVTDNAENRTYIRSDGIIMYTDSTITTDEISYTKLDPQDKDLSVTLNGNTIASITNGSATLTKNTDYRIENNKIILKHEYLNSLYVDDYELTIHFTPAGEANLDPNVALPSSTVTLYIEKANQQHPPEDAKFNNLNSSYTYGDDPGIISLNGGSGTGAVTYSSTNPDVAIINPTTGKLTILNAGTFEIIATKAADDNYEELVVTSSEIAVNRRPATISGITAKSKIYDGNINAEFDMTNAQIQNLVNNDQITINPGTASLTDKNVANGKTVSFFGFALTGNDAPNYTLSAQPADTTANITPKPVTIIDVAAESKVYDSTTNATPVISNASINDKINGDDLSFIAGSASFTDKNVANGKTVSFSGFALTGNDAANYTLSAQPANTNANITTKSVTIIGVTAENKVYDGSEHTTPIISSSSIDGAISDDNLSFVTGSASFSDKNVANAKTVTFDGFALSGTDANNYTLSAQPADTTANITPKEVIIIGITAQDKVYDGTTNATIVTSNASITNKIYQDDLSFIAGSASFSDKNVANGKTVTFANFVLSGIDANNYTLSNQPANTTSNITPKPVIITGVTAENKVYDGNKDATPITSNASINDKIDGDDLSFSVGTASFTDKNAANGKTVTFTDFALSGNDINNYTLSNQPANTTANITPKPITITGITAQDKVYDGTPYATPITSDASINDKVDGDDLSVTTGTASFTDKNVADGKAVAFSDFSLSGNDARNYTLSDQPDASTANILTKSLTISNIVIKDKVFDGSKTAELDGNPTLEGLADGDDITLVNGTPMFTSSDIGTNILINFSTPFSLEGTDASNYSITQPAYNIYGNIIAYSPSDDSNKDNDDDQTSSSSAPGNDSNSSSSTSGGDSNSESSASGDDSNSGSSTFGNDSNSGSSTPGDDTVSGSESDTAEDDIISGAFEAEDPATGIQVSATEGVVPPWCILVVEEIYPNTDEHNETYDKLDNEKKAISEHYKLYEIHLEDQDGNIIQPDISKGLMTVRIPVPYNYDLSDLEIYRINKDTDDDFDERVVTINNRNYCEYRTDHFSPYAMIDKNTIYDMLPYLIIFLILLFIALFIIIILKRRKDREEEKQQQ